MWKNRERFRIAAVKGPEISDAQDKEWQAGSGFSWEHGVR